MTLTLDTSPKGMILARQMAGPLPKSFQVLGTLRGNGYTGTPLVQSTTGRYLRVANGTIRGFDTVLALSLIDEAEGADKWQPSKIERVLS